MEQSTAENNLDEILTRLSKRQLARLSKFVWHAAIPGFGLLRRSAPATVTEPPYDFSDCSALDLEHGAKAAAALAHLCDGANRQLFEALAAVLFEKAARAPQWRPGEREEFLAAMQPKFDALMARLASPAASRESEAPHSAPSSGPLELRGSNRLES